MSRRRSMFVEPWSGVSSAGPSGVRGAARVHSSVGNRRGPSAPSASGKDRGYGPMVKILGGQRESEGVVVPLVGVAGTPNGGAISPLLASISLHVLDTELSRGNVRTGRADQRSEQWFNGHGLHRLRGTIRYPKAA